MMNTYSKINKTEEEITSGWNGNFDNPLVSIVCHVYNHEKYIASALDGFLMQETSFPFEVIVHDDASTDNSVNIIKEYVIKYPKIIKPIYEKTNVYSKHDGSIRRIIINEVQGAYMAMCEGDDFWTDENKLQVQYNIMESNQDCFLCVHNTIIHDLSRKKRDSLFNNWNEQKELKANDVFMGWNVHTSSYFMKSSLYEKLIEFPNSKNYYFGDYVLLCLAFYYGKVIYLPSVMSLYNINNKFGITYNVMKSNIQTKVNNEMLRINFIKAYNEYTSNKYINYTKNAIEYYQLLCELYKGNYRALIGNWKHKNAFCNLPKSLKLYIYVNAYFPKTISFLRKLKKIYH